MNKFIKSFLSNESVKPSEISCSNHPIIVVDIGCRWGFAERFINEKYLSSFRIFGFDPDEAECHRLQEFYSNLPVGFVSCVPLGLAGSVGSRHLYLTKEPACSSLYVPIKFLADTYPALECIRLEKTITVDVVTLNQWAQENIIEYIDYIKIDTQGSELEILKGADDIIGSTRCIDIEVEFNPIYEGQSLFGETDVYLRSKGFVLWRLSNLVHYSLSGEQLPLTDKNIVCFDTNIRQEAEAYGGQLFWADAKYIHRDVLVPKLPDSTQMERDILLFDALGMDDVVAHINKVALKI